MTDLDSHLERAVSAGDLLESSGKNIRQFLERAASPIYQQSIEELVAAGEWAELNDRFFRTLAFGTGGLRGRTIGKIVTTAERGMPTELDRPQYPCVGTNAMNFFNISRATQGLVAYVRDWFAKENKFGKPGIAIAYDTRHFSREFAELAARVATENGCDVHLFSAPRSTPELSFMVRFTNSHAGIVLTASHNPPHDNGFKCYFADGGQVVEPHASGIIAKVNAVESDAYTPLAPEQQGTLQMLDANYDNNYMRRLDTLVLDFGVLLAGQKDLRIVYSSLHGTGGVIIKPMLKRLGLQFSVVPEQDEFDGRFPTVKSPNPENAEALSMAIALAKKEGADLVIATDPDCDRMGIAARNAAGEMQLFTGNQIGSLIAFYRVRKLIERGVITEKNVSHCAIIKTFVTTDLQKAIAEKNGIRCVETLTGFKYIGQKLAKYEAALPPNVRNRYRQMEETRSRDVRLESSTYYVCGGEESYGYSAHDFVRDKDGNAAAIVFAEVAAYAKARGLTLDALLNEVYSEYGFYSEKNGSLTFEGAEGAVKIKKLADSYAANPPTEIDGAVVTSVKNFASEIFYDVEGDRIPAEKMLILELSDGRRAAVRPSGTEPKIKYYLFARREPEAGRSFSKEELAAIMGNVETSLEALWDWLQKDAHDRLA